MGPFPKNFNGDSLIIAETKKNIDFKEIDYEAKRYAGKIRTPPMVQICHNLWHIFPETKAGALYLQRLMLIQSKTGGNCSDR